MPWLGVRLTKSRQGRRSLSGRDRRIALGHEQMFAPTARVHSQGEIAAQRLMRTRAQGSESAFGVSSPTRSLRTLAVKLSALCGTCTYIATVVGHIAVTLRLQHVHLLIQHCSFQTALYS
jgi:hypothetical protein